jgi:hypothetical protein
MAILKNGDTAPVEPYLNLSMLMYDSGGNAFMNEPVVDWALNFQSTYACSVFPAPTFTYPQRSQLKFEITSGLINTEVPATLYLTFHGHFRVPC